MVALSLTVGVFHLYSVDIDQNSGMFGVTTHLVHLNP
jgi:hypothetical protein